MGYSMAINEKTAKRNRQIKEFCKDHTQTEAAKKFGLSQGRISLIINNPLSGEVMV